MAYGDSAAGSLAAIRTAIGKTLNAQEYSVGGRRAAMATLKTLREMERELETEVSRASAPLFAVAQIDRPT